MAGYFKIEEKAIKINRVTSHSKIKKWIENTNKNMLDIQFSILRNNKISLTGKEKIKTLNP